MSFYPLDPVGAAVLGGVDYLPFLLIPCFRAAHSFVEGGNYVQ